MPEEVKKKTKKKASAAPAPKKGRWKLPTRYSQALAEAKRTENPFFIEQAEGRIKARLAKRTRVA